MFTPLTGKHFHNIVVTRQDKMASTILTETNLQQTVGLGEDMLMLTLSTVKPFHHILVARRDKMAPVMSIAQNLHTVDPDQGTRRSTNRVEPKTWHLQVPAAKAVWRAPRQCLLPRRQHHASAFLIEDHCGGVIGRRNLRYRKKKWRLASS